MNSHLLANKYAPVPDALKERLVGEPVEVPDIEDANDNPLTGYRVALVATHGPELPEFDVTVDLLKEPGRDG